MKKWRNLANVKSWGAPMSCGTPRARPSLSARARPESTGKCHSLQNALRRGLGLPLLGLARWGQRSRAADGQAAGDGAMKRKVSAFRGSEFVRGLEAGSLAARALQ